MEQNYQNILIHTVAFPPIQWVAEFFQARTLFIEAHENYQKKSARNRYHLGSHQGIHTLSIPLEKGKNHQMKIMEVRISFQEDWQGHQLKFFQSVYGRSPFFEFYKDDLISLFSEREVSLFQFNLKALSLLKSWLSFPASIQLTSSYQKSPDSDTMDFRSLPWPPLNDVNPFYDQVFGIEFLPNLSILDLVFHLGPEAPAYLIKYDPKL